MGQLALLALSAPELGDTRLGAAVVWVVAPLSSCGAVLDR